MAQDNKQLAKKINGGNELATSFKKRALSKTKELAVRLASLSGESVAVDEKGFTETSKRLFSGLMYATMKVPQIAECKIETVGNCLLQSAVTGLYPGAMDECYYLPYGKDCTFIADYRGLVKLAYQSGFVKDINYGAVFPEDDFDYQNGTDPFIKHISHTDEEIPQNMTHAYCVVRLSTGGCVFSVMTKKQVDGVKNQSKSGSSQYSPWNKHYIAMALKTVIKRALKTIPKSATLQKALAIEAVTDNPDPSTSQIVDAEVDWAEFTEVQNAD